MLRAENQRPDFNALPRGGTSGVVRDGKRCMGAVWMKWVSKCY
jgi:hypothetical protein